MDNQERLASIARATVEKERDRIARLEADRDELRARVRELQARLHAAETLTRTHEDATTRVRAENQKLKDRVVQVRVTHEECEVRCDAARVEITRLRRECVLHASRLSWDDLPNLTPGEMRHRAHAVMAKLRDIAKEGE